MIAPPWTEEEFEVLLQHPELNDESLAALMGRWSVGTITIVRNGVHAWHVGRPIPEVLNQMMMRRLARGNATCPRCGAVVGSVSPLAPATGADGEPEAARRTGGCMSLMMAVLGLVGTLLVTS